MTTPSRIYRVETPDTGAIRLVRATNQPAAVRHVARDLAVRVASQDDLVDALSKGVKVETAGEQAEQQAA